MQDFRRHSASAARWLTRTRLCWQRKKNGKLRPIKMGEFLRSAYAKRLVNLSQVHLRTKTLHMHQWGVNLPGACEALCHWRGTIEPLLVSGSGVAVISGWRRRVLWLVSRVRVCFATLCCLFGLWGSSSGYLVCSWPFSAQDDNLLLSCGFPSFNGNVAWFLAS